MLIGVPLVLPCHLCSRGPGALVPRGGLGGTPFYQATKIEPILPIAAPIAPKTCPPYRILAWPDLEMSAVIPPFRPIEGSLEGSVATCQLRIGALAGAATGRRMAGLPPPLPKPSRLCPGPYQSARTPDAEGV